MLHRWALVIASVVMIIGCGESKPSAQQRVESAAPKEKPLSDIYHMEDYTDPSQWTEPRMQFLAKIKAQNQKGIWSSKLDGSDIRLAWSFKAVTDVEGGVTNHAPVRSPNNRYIAIGLSSSAGLSRILVDLKSGAWERMDFGGSPPSFTWSSDSKNVIFWSGGDVKKFNVETKILTKLSDDLHGIFIYLLKDQKTLLGVGSTSYSYYDIESGKKLKTTKLDLNSPITYSRISAEEQHLFFRYEKGLGVADLKNDEVIFKTVDYKKPNGERLSIGDAIFSGTDSTIVFWRRGGLYVLDPQTGETAKKNEMSFRPFRLTLINKQALLD